jgi:hypothetical protein
MKNKIGTCDHCGELRELHRCPYCGDMVCGECCGSGNACYDCNPLDDHEYDPEPFEFN